MVSIVLKTVILFIAAFFAGYIAGGAFGKKRTHKKTKDLPKTETEVRLIKTIKRQEVYN